MNLDPNAREFYTLTITTTPAVTSWDASFDNGGTWFTGAAVAGQADTFRWLVAGPTATVGAAVAVIGAWSVLPKVRATSSPEIVVRDAPRITVTR